MHRTGRNMKCIREEVQSWESLFFNRKLCMGTESQVNLGILKKQHERISTVNLT